MFYYWPSALYYLFMTGQQAYLRLYETWVHPRNCTNEERKNEGWWWDDDDNNNRTEFGNMNQSLFGDMKKIARKCWGFRSDMKAPEGRKSYGAMRRSQWGTYGAMVRSQWETLVVQWKRANKWLKSSAMVPMSDTDGKSLAMVLRNGAACIGLSFHLKQKLGDPHSRCNLYSAVLQLEKQSVQ